MKKMRRILSILMIAVFVLTMVPATNIEAKEKSKVTYTLKDGVLTIKGKGNMPKKMTFANQKIKKVVINKGVTSISDYAFSELTNLESVKISNTVTKIGRFSFKETGLKKVTIPKSVKKIGCGAFVNCENLTEVKMPGNFEFIYNYKDSGGEDFLIFDDYRIEKITFTTNLNLDIITFIGGEYWEVSDKDKNYKSIDGVIYSKDGKELVRVPQGMQELKVADGCTTLCINAFLYGIDENHDIVVPGASGLKRLVLPKSVTKVNDKKYNARNMATMPVMTLNEIVVEDIWQFDSKDIIKLAGEVKSFLKGVDESSFELMPLMSFLENRIEEKDGLLILDKTVLLDCIDRKEKMVIPEGIKSIADRAFEVAYGDNDVIKEVVFPNGLEEIGDRAFCENSKLNIVNFPSTLKRVGSSAFFGTNLEKVDIPSTVEKLGSDIFAYSSVKEATLPDNMKVIPAGMFGWCSELEKINVPKNLTTVGKDAFNSTKINVKVFLENKKLTTIKAGAFENTSWKKITIPKNIKSIGSRGITPKKPKNAVVTIVGETKGYKTDAFFDKLADGNHIKLKFKGKVAGYFTCISKIYPKTKENWKNTFVKIKWIKVNNADGYQIVTSSNKKYTQSVKKVNVGSNKKQTTIKIAGKIGIIYVKIRPYKKVNGKKVYGKWSKSKY